MVLRVFFVHMCIHVYNGSDSWPAVNVCNKAKQAKWWKTPGVRDSAGSAGAGVTDCVSVCLCLSDGDQNSRWDGCWCVWDEIQVRAVCVQMKQSWYLVRCVYTLAKVLNVYCSTEVRVCACLAQGPINLLAVVKQATAEGKEKKTYM